MPRSSRLKAFCLSLVLYLLFPTPLRANVASTIEPEFVGQHYAWPVIKQTTSDVFDLETEFFKHYLLFYPVQPVESTLSPELYGELEQVLQYGQKDGNGVIKLENYRNLCGDTDDGVFDQIIEGMSDAEAYDLIVPLLPNLSAKEGGNSSLVNNLMQRDSNFNKLEVARQYAFTVYDNVVNYWQLGGPYQRMTSLQQQADYKAGIAVDEHNKCNKMIMPGLKSDILCGNISYTNKNTTSKELARYVSDHVGKDAYIDVLSTPVKTLIKILALEEIKSSYSLFFVVTPPVRQNFFDFPKKTVEPTIIRVQCPAYSLNKQGEFLYKVQSAQEKGEAGWIDGIKKTTETVHGNNSNEWIFNKVKDLYGDNCNNPPKEPLDLRGPSASSKTIGSGIWNWTFSFAGSIDEARKTDMKVCIHALIPPEMGRLQKKYYEGLDAMIGNFFPLSWREELLKNISKTEIPLVEENSVAKTRPGYVPTSEQILCDVPNPNPQDNPECYKQEAVGIKWSANPKAMLFNPNFYSIASVKTTFLPLDQNKGGKERFISACWFKNMANKVDNVMAARVPGFSLAKFFKLLEFGIDIPTNCGTLPSAPRKVLASPTQLGNVCKIAEENGVDCKILLGVWELETGGATACTPNCWSDPSKCTIVCSEAYVDKFVKGCDIDDPGAAGPAQIQPGIAKQADSSLDRCKLPDALILMAKILKDIKNFGTEVTTADYTPVGRYMGCNECLPSDQTQARWGAGVSYCDAIESYVNTGDLPSSPGDSSFDSLGSCCWRGDQKIYDKDYCPSGTSE